MLKNMQKGNKVTRVHFMGIGGSGASGVARIAKEYGYEVSGCDLEEGKNTRILEKEGFTISIGHSADHLKNVDMLAHTPAVLDQSVAHPEYLVAKKKGKAMIWEEFMAKFLMKEKFVVAVAGTHGKGTTAAMLGIIMEKAGLDPTVEMGTGLLNWQGRNYRVGKSQYFLCEADEYRDKFLLYKPNLAIVTSIELDHPDYFKDFETLLSSFVKFVSKLVPPRVLVLCRSNKGCQELAKKLKKNKFSGKISWYDTLPKSKIKLRIPGEHIRQDATGAWVAAASLGVKDKAIKEALQSFSGCERRFEYKGEFEGVKVYDDYAHHPTAVKVNIDAARELYPKKKIWVVFQPHMYSRLQALFDDFVESLRLADRVVVTDVYTRREQGITKPSGKDLALAIGAPKATYVGGGFENVANFVERNSKKGDVAVVMGAGDSYKIAEMLVQK